MQSGAEFLADFPQALVRATAVLDLSLGGVHAELGDDVFNWFEVPAAAAVKVAPAVVAAQASVVKAPALDVALPSVREAAEAPVRQSVPQAVETAEVWVDGEAGGVLLLVQGAMPDARCQTLARAMLAAVGLQDAALGWVGYSGKVSVADLLAAVRGREPRHVLVLGQAPLGALLGRNLGVEGWHASDSQVIDGWDGVVGVTYPLDLLLKQSLFKRLAWQHLLAWQGAMNLTLNELAE